MNFLSVFVYYKLKESLADGTLSCEIKTRDPYEALAHLLIMVRKPVTGHVNRSLWLTTVKIGLEAKSVPFNTAAMFHLVMVVVAKEDNKPLYKVELTTEISEEVVDLGISEYSNKLYSEPAYVRTIDIIMKRMARWSQDNVDIAKTLCCFAARDADHPFWSDQDYLTMGTGLHRALSDECFHMFEYKH